jgi:hypothetical protein
VDRAVEEVTLRFQLEFVYSLAPCQKLFKLENVSDETYSARSKLRRVHAGR